MGLSHGHRFTLGDISSALKNPIVAGIIVGITGAIVGAFFGALFTYLLTRPGCTNNSVFIADINIPDRTELKPDEQFEKQWLLRNPKAENVCPWTREYNAVWIDGPNLASQPFFYVPETPPGENAIVNVPMKAPKAAGEYKSAWILRTDKGQKFGDPFWVIIVVK